MRTAEEHLRVIYNCTDPSDYLQLNITLNPDVLLLTKAINEARKEVIEECAALTPNEKESILKLINELK